MHHGLERHIVFCLSAVQHPIQRAFRVNLMQRLARRLTHRQLQHLAGSRIQIDDALALVDGKHAFLQCVPDVRPLHHQPIQILRLVARQLVFDVAGQPPCAESADAQRHRGDEQILQHRAGHHPVYRPHVNAHHGVAQQIALLVEHLGAGAPFHAVLGFALLQKHRLGLVRIRLNHPQQTTAGAGPGHQIAVRVDDHRHIQIAHPAHHLP